MFKTINGGKLPTKGSKYSACVDLYANADITIGAGETKLVPLGVCVDFRKFWDGFLERNYKNDTEDLKQQHRRLFLKSHYLQLMLRSSLSKHLIIANGVGVVDLDYKDEIMIRVHNPIDMFNVVNDDFCEEFEIKKGDKIAQITLLEHKTYLFGIETDKERTGGFGSTGK